MQAARQEFTWEQYYRVQDLLSALLPAGGPRGEAKEARDAIRDAFDRWVGACLESIAAGYLRAFLLLLRQFEEHYRSAKDEQGLLDFNDLLLVASTLLDPPDGRGTPDYFRRRFRQVMVDEFQDTNRLQFRIIRALQGDGHLFMVGDVKQAIYRFIGSDVQVFLGQEARIAALGDKARRLAMSVNYRSRVEILGVVNGLFSRLWSGEEVGFPYEPLSAGKEFALPAQPAVEMAFWPLPGSSIAELRDREAAWIARRILQLTGRLDAPALEITAGEEQGTLSTRPAEYKDVVLLFRASSDIPRYEDALRQAGIPFYVVSGRGFYQAREVQDLVHMLRVLDNPLDDFALAVVLRSPLAGISDDTLYWLSREWSAWSPGESYPSQASTNPQGGVLWENMLRLLEWGEPGEPAVAVDSIDPVEQVGPRPITEEDLAILAAFYRTVQVLQEEMPAGQPLDLIDLILARTGFTSRLLATEGGEQRFANVQKLREVAATFQARGIFDLSDFQRYLTQLEKIAPREASAPLDVEASQVVRLMTIHAAKGLEAPIVFLADCGREPVRDQARFLLTGTGLSCTLPTPEGEWAPTAAYQTAQQQLAADDRHESERLLYVALTRAAEHLICCGSAGFSAASSSPSYADLLLDLLGLEALPDADVEVPVSYEGTEYPVRVWSPAALTALETAPAPERAKTLWEEYREAILAGRCRCWPPMKWNPLPASSPACAGFRNSVASARCASASTAPSATRNVRGNTGSAMSCVVTR